MADVDTGISDQAYHEYMLMCKSKGIVPTSRKQLAGGMGSNENKEKEVKTKVCKRCEEDKPLREFYTNKQMKDGHESTCKACKKETAKKPDLARPEQRIIDDPSATQKQPVLKYISIKKARVFVQEAYALGFKEGRENVAECDTTLQELLGFA
jgi:hypothetical protein